MKKIMDSLMIGSLLVLLAACGETVGTSGATNTEGGSKTLKLAHDLGEDHPVHLALTKFAKTVEESSEGQMKVEIFSNGVLGNEREMLEQIQGGGIDITKVSAASLESFASSYSIFSLPYVFDDEEHFFRSMESDAVSDLFASTEDEGFLGLTWYDSGSRNFYTADKPIMHPDDLKGLKIRVIDSRTQIEMVKTLGGAPTPMPYGEIYTALQSGVIDGAESNPTALTTGKHGEVAKAFSFDEHTRIPDIVVISSSAWNNLTETQQNILKEAAVESTEYQKEIWAKALEAAKKEAENLGVEFYYPEKGPFREAASPIYKEYRKDERLAALLDAFNEMR
ncbi:C4-dicarboxylate ABC transporter substrate-binding protein [Shouchella clausii]|uniref:TRAP transporter substrate-binding protein n=1 Tax=Shouchella clausii TaxID=79880 RepID=UPI001AFF38F7|nr:TRAP transporter substrate-binding protein [Shouchella clausii]GIN08960.1 C4-dicarboxylate ABC transporter substrate-binding protein [Shouchella clausii]